PTETSRQDSLRVAAGMDWFPGRDGWARSDRSGDWVGAGHVYGDSLISPLRPSLCRRVMAIRDHVYLLERNQPATNHLIEHGKDLVDLLLRLDALDNYREVEGELEKFRRVYAAAGAVTHDAVRDGSARVVPSP